MADLPSVFAKINDVEVSQDASVTENLLNRLGQNDNYLKDNLDAEITARTNGDSSLQSQINSIESELNTKLVNVPALVASGTIAGTPEMTVSGYVSSVFFHKSFPTSKTFLEIKIFNDATDSMVWETQTDLSVVPTAWSSSSWFWDAQNDLVYWYLFNNVTVSV